MSRENPNNNDNENGDGTRWVFLAIGAALAAFVAFASMQTGREAVEEVSPGIASSNN